VKNKIPLSFVQSIDSLAVDLNPHTSLEQQTGSERRAPAMTAQILNVSSSERGEHIKNLLHYCRYNCGIYLTHYLQLSINSYHDVKYIAKLFIPKQTRVLYLPASCRISFDLYQQELLSITTNDWERFLKSMIHAQDSDPTKILTPHKILFTIGMIGLLKKYSLQEMSSSSSSSLSCQYLSFYWKALPSLSNEDILPGWNSNDLNDLSATSFLYHDLIVSSIAQLQVFYQQHCLPFMKRFPEIFASPSPDEGPLNLPLSLLYEDGYLTFPSFLSLYNLISSRTFATNQDTVMLAPLPPPPLMLLPVIDYLNGTCESNQENCHLEFYCDEQDTSSTAVKGMYNIITSRDILPGEELILSYLPSQDTSLSVYLFTYGTLPQTIKSLNSLSSETLTLHLHPSLQYLQSQLPLSSADSGADFVQFFHSLFGLSNTLSLTAPLSLSHQQLFHSLSAYLTAHLVIPSPDPKSRLLNCLTEMLCCLPTPLCSSSSSSPRDAQTPPSVPALSPSQSLICRLSALFDRWVVSQQVQSMDSDRLRCALTIHLIEHRLRLETMKFLKSLVVVDRDTPTLLPLTDYECSGGDLMNQIADALHLDHPPSSSPSPSSTLQEEKESKLDRESGCAWCGKSSGEAQVKKLFQCSRCKGVRYCRCDLCLCLSLDLPHRHSSLVCQKSHWKTHKLICQPRL
jgi:hypothetical protein